MNRIILFLKVFLVFVVGFEFSRLYFIIYHINELKDGFLNVWAMTLFSGFALDVSTAMYCMAPLIILVLVEGVFRKQLPIWYFKFFIVFDLFCLFAITISDPEFYRQWGAKFNNQVLVYLSHPKEMVISTGAVLWGKTIVFALIYLLILIVLYRILIKMFNKERRYSIINSGFELIAALLCFILLRGGIGVTTISQNSAIFSDNRLYNSASVNSLWNALYYIINDVENLYGNSYKFIDDSGAENELNAQFDSDTSGLDLSENSKPNIMIVMLESFTASASKLLEGEMDCMPYLDKISTENLCFLNCYSSGERTEKGLVSVLSGYPAQPMSSIIVFPDKMSQLNSLGKMLRKEGYKNSFFYGGDADFASMKAFLIVHGIDNIVDKKQFDKKSLNSKWGAHDANLYSRVIEDHKRISEPFFSTILSLSSHEPYEVNYVSNDIERDNWYPYKNSIRYADSCLADFLRQCQQQSWYNNTIIVLVADHGHDIGLKDKLFLGKEKYHIPLVITGGALKQRWKGVAMKQTISQTIIPSLLLGSMGLPVADFQWQTGVYSKHPFAQYQFNYGFGRVENESSAVYETDSKNYQFFGASKDSLALQRNGRVFQQVLINNFIKK